MLDNRFLWVRIAALDFPVVPPVYCNSAVSSPDNLISDNLFFYLIILENL